MDYFVEQHTGVDEEYFYMQLEKAGFEKKIPVVQNQSNSQPEVSKDHKILLLNAIEVCNSQNEEHLISLASTASDDLKENVEFGKAAAKCGNIQSLRILHENKFTLNWEALVCAT